MNIQENIAIQKKHDELNGEILRAIEAKDDLRVEQLVATQKKLASILDKRKSEEVIFAAKKLEDDELYTKAKEAGDQELLDKFHDRSLKRTDYIKACEAYHIEPGVDDYYNNLERFDEIRDFKNGFAAVRMGNKRGFINEKNEEICECIYDRVWDFKNGFAEVRIGGKRGVINEEGKEICACIYDEVFHFKNGIFGVRIGGKRGVINEEGKEICKCIYDWVWDSKNGFDEVRIGDKRGVINEERKYFENRPE